MKVLLVVINPAATVSRTPSADINRKKKQKSLPWEEFNWENKKLCYDSSELIDACGKTPLTKSVSDSPPPCGWTGNAVSVWEFLCLSLANNNTVALIYEFHHSHF